MRLHADLCGATVTFWLETLTSQVEIPQDNHGTNASIIVTLTKFVSECVAAFEMLQRSSSAFLLLLFTQDHVCQAYPRH